MGDEGLVGAHRTDVLGRDGQSQVDAVGDVQAGSFAGVLDLADEVTGVALRDQFRIKLRVEDGEAPRVEDRGHLTTARLNGGGQFKLAWV